MMTHNELVKAALAAYGQSGLLEIEGRRLRRAGYHDGQYELQVYYAAASWRNEARRLRRLCEGVKRCGGRGTSVVAVESASGRVDDRCQGWRDASRSHLAR